MATPTRKCKYEGVRWSLSCSSLAVRCVGVSAFRFPVVGVLSLVAISTTHYALHCSHECGMVAWQRGHVQHAVWLSSRRPQAKSRAGWQPSTSNSFPSCPLTPSVTPIELTKLVPHSKIQELLILDAMCTGLNSQLIIRGVI